jgi:predicted metal-binding membrane protein
MWMPMCGQTWLGAAAAFVLSWTLMMAPMMLPSLTPGLWAFWRQARRETSAPAASLLTALVGAAYFLVWAMAGAIVFAAGATLAAMLMRSPTLAQAAPIASSVVMALAGAVQFTAWKARRIACCRSAALHGLRLARHCGYSCANLMIALLVFDMMDWRAMTAATLAMSAERLAPAPRPTAKAIGAFMIAAGLACGHLT